MTCPLRCGFSVPTRTAQLAGDFDYDTRGHGYARPDAFLDPRVRAAQSAWGFVEPDAAERAVTALRRDLASGEWEQRYGHLRDQPEFRGSLRLLVGRP